MIKGKMKRTNLKYKMRLEKPLKVAEVMESCQNVIEERMNLIVLGGEGFKGVMTKSTKTKQESSEENRLKDEKGLIIPVSILILYMILAGIKKKEIQEYCWTL